MGFLWEIIIFLNAIFTGLSFFVIKILLLIVKVGIFFMHYLGFFLFDIYIPFQFDVYSFFFGFYPPFLLFFFFLAMYCPLIFGFTKSLLFLAGDFLVCAEMVFGVILFVFDRICSFFDFFCLKLLDSVFVANIVVSDLVSNGWFGFAVSSATFPTASIPHIRSVFLDFRPFVIWFDPAAMINHILRIREPKPTRILRRKRSLENRRLIVEFFEGTGRNYDPKVFLGRDKARLSYVYEKPLLNTERWMTRLVKRSFRFRNLLLKDYKKEVYKEHRKLSRLADDLEQYRLSLIDAGLSPIEIEKDKDYGIHLAAWEKQRSSVEHYDEISSGTSEAFLQALKTGGQLKNQPPIFSLEPEPLMGYVRTMPFIRRQYLYNQVKAFPSPVREAGFGPSELSFDPFVDYLERAYQKTPLHWSVLQPVLKYERFVESDGLLRFKQPRLRLPAVGATGSGFLGGDPLSSAPSFLAVDNLVHSMPSYLRRQLKFFRGGKTSRKISIPHKRLRMLSYGWPKFKRQGDMIGKLNIPARRVILRSRYRFYDVSQYNVLRVFDEAPLSPTLDNFVLRPGLWSGVPRSKTWLPADLGHYTPISKRVRFDFLPDLFFYDYVSYINYFFWYIFLCFALVLFMVVSVLFINFYLLRNYLHLVRLRSQYTFERLFVLAYFFISVVVGLFILLSNGTLQLAGLVSGVALPVFWADYNLFFWLPYNAEWNIIERGIFFSSGIDPLIFSAMGVEGTPIFSESRRWFIYRSLFRYSFFMPSFKISAPQSIMKGYIDPESAYWFHKYKVPRRLRRKKEFTPYLFIDSLAYFDKRYFRGGYKNSSKYPIGYYPFVVSSFVFSYVLGFLFFFLLSMRSRGINRLFSVWFLSWLAYGRGKGFFPFKFVNGSAALGDVSFDKDFFPGNKGSDSLNLLESHLISAFRLSGGYASPEHKSFSDSFVSSIPFRRISTRSYFSFVKDTFFHLTDELSEEDETGFEDPEDEVQSLYFEPWSSDVALIDPSFYTPVSDLSSLSKRPVAATYLSALAPEIFEPVWQDDQVLQDVEVDPFFSFLQMQDEVSEEISEDRENMVGYDEYYHHLEPYSFFLDTSDSNELEADYLYIEDKYSAAEIDFFQYHEDHPALYLPPTLFRHNRCCVNDFSGLYIFTCVDVNETFGLLRGDFEAAGQRAIIKSLFPAFRDLRYGYGDLAVLRGLAMETLGSPLSFYFNPSLARLLSSDVSLKASLFDYLFSPIQSYESSSLYKSFSSSFFRLSHLKRNKLLRRQFPFFYRGIRKPWKLSTRSGFGSAGFLNIFVDDLEDEAWDLEAENYGAISSRYQMVGSTMDANGAQPFEAVWPGMGSDALAVEHDVRLLGTFFPFMLSSCGNTSVSSGQPDYSFYSSPVDRTLFYYEFAGEDAEALGAEEPVINSARGDPADEFMKYSSFESVDAFPIEPEFESTYVPDEVDLFIEDEMFKEWFGDKAVSRVFRQEDSFFTELLGIGASEAVFFEYDWAEIASDRSFRAKVRNWRKKGSVVYFPREIDRLFLFGLVSDFRRVGFSYLYASSPFVASSYPSLVNFVESNLERYDPNAFFPRASWIEFLYKRYDPNRVVFSHVASYYYRFLATARLFWVDVSQIFFVFRKFAIGISSLYLMLQRFYLFCSFYVPLSRTGIAPHVEFAEAENSESYDGLTLSQPLVFSNLVSETYFSQGLNFISPILFVDQANLSTFSSVDYLRSHFFGLAEINPFENQVYTTTISEENLVPGITDEADRRFEHGNLLVNFYLDRVMLVSVATPFLGGLVGRNRWVLFALGFGFRSPGFNYYVADLFFWCVVSKDYNRAVIFPLFGLGFVLLSAYHVSLAKRRIVSLRRLILLVSG